jgi:hypothetical protein
MVSRPSRRASQQNVGDGLGLATDSVVLCNLMHSKTTCANSEGSKFMLSSLNNTVSNLHPQGVTQAYREWERSETHGEYTSTRCGEDTPGKGEIPVARGEYTSTRYGANITGKGKIPVARGESGPVGNSVVGCARSRIEEASDGVPRADVCTSRRGGPGQGTVWGSSGDTGSNGCGSGASGAARKPGWRWLACGATGICAGSRGVKLGVRGGV